VNLTIIGFSKQEEIQKSVCSTSPATEGTVGGQPKDITDVESYCIRMLQENPSDLLFLKTYAQFLYQVYTSHRSSTVVHE